MKLKKVLACLIVGTLVASVPVGVLAKNYSVTQEQGVQGIIEAIHDETNEDGTYTITLESGEYDFDGNALNLEGKTYEINGTDITLTDVIIGGNGTITITANIENKNNEAALNVGNDENTDLSVTVNGDVTGSTPVETDQTDDEGNTIYSASGISVWNDGSGDITVNVNGNVSTELPGQGHGIWTDGSGSKTVNVSGSVETAGTGIGTGGGETSITAAGGIKSTNGNAVQVNGEATLVVTGNITAGNAEDEEDWTAGVYTDSAYDENGEIPDSAKATVTINGDINATGDAVTGKGTAKITVNGDVNSSTADGVYALEESDIAVTGDVSGRNAGVNAHDDSTVTVIGDVSGNDTENEWDQAGTGVIADGSATVTVDGDVTGGNGVNYNGYGIQMYSTANVEVTGDVSSGNAGSTEWTQLFDAVKITLANSGDAGSLKANNVTLGTTAAEDYYPGYGIWIDTDNPYTLEPGDDYDCYLLCPYEDDGTLYAEDTMYLTFGILQYIEDTDSDKLEAARAVVDKYNNAKNTILSDAVNQLSDESQRNMLIEIRNGSDINYAINTSEQALETYRALVDQLDEIKNEEGETVLEQLAAAYQEARGELEDLCPFPDTDDLVIPTVTVASVSSNGYREDAWGAEDGEEDGSSAILSRMSNKISYTVQTDAANGTVKTDKDSYQAGETVTITPVANDGYELSKVTVTTADGKTELKVTEKDGVYTAVMPADGTGMLVEAEFTKKPASATETDKDTTTTDVAKSDGTKTTSPKTSDGQMAGLWVALGGVAGVAVAATSRKKKTCR